jgi:hypothetical protein
VLYLTFIHPTIVGLKLVVLSCKALKKVMENFVCKAGNFTKIKRQDFSPQNGDFSKLWPSSRFGLAMAVIDGLDLF